MVATRGFLITFSGTGDPQPDTHVIRNWAEKLSCDTQRNGWGTVENPDTATDKVSVTASSARALGNLAGAIKRTLRHHNLLDQATVTKLSSTIESEQRETALSRKRYDG